MPRFCGELKICKSAWWLLGPAAGCLVGCAASGPAPLTLPGALSAIDVESIQDDQENLTARQRRQLEIFQSILLSSSSADVSPQTRRGAAEELIAMQIAPATSILRQALGSPSAAALIAVIEAMEASSEPVAGLLATVIARLQNGPPEVVERLSSLLPRYGQPALQQTGAAARSG